MVGKGLPAPSRLEEGWQVGFRALARVQIQAATHGAFGLWYLIALNLADRCSFQVEDLDGGLPEGAPVDLILCYLFRDQRLDGAMIERLALGGLLAVAIQSEVGAGPGPFRARPGELRDAYGELGVLVHGEGDGMAWILARRQA